MAGLTAVAVVGWLTDLAGLDFTTLRIVSGDETGGDHGGKDGGAQGGKLDERPGGIGPRGKDGYDFDGKDGGKDSGGKDGDVALACDPDELIAALVFANANGGSTLKLARRCTYTLTANQGGNGLPTIVAPIEIKGDDTTIVRGADAAPFRIFDVGVGGVLTLSNVTVKGGGRGGLKDGSRDPSQDRGRNGGGKGARRGGGARTRSWDGGAILVRPGGTLHVSHSTIRDSTGANGGGIMNAGTTTLTATIVTDNHATGHGGAIHNEGFLTVEQSHLTYNKANVGGGLENLGGVALITRTAIGNNVAGTGGGIRVDGAARTTTITDSTITENTALNGGGGGVDNHGSSLTLRKSTVSRNIADRDGGGVRNTGTLVLHDSLVNANRATHGNGGGISNKDRGAVAVLHTSEVTANRAPDARARGGGIHNFGGRFTLVDTRVIDNRAGHRPGGVFSQGGIFAVDNGSIIIKNLPTNCVGSPDPIPNCFG